MFVIAMCANILDVNDIVQTDTAQYPVPSIHRWPKWTSPTIQSQDHPPLHETAISNLMSGGLKQAACAFHLKKSAVSSSYRSSQNPIVLPPPQPIDHGSSFFLALSPLAAFPFSKAPLLS